MNTLERRFAIWDVMRQRKFDTAPHLAKEFNVSVRTIYRDVEWLSSMFDLAPRRGKYGGIYVNSVPETLKRYLTPEQETMIREILPTLSPKEPR